MDEADLVHSAIEAGQYEKAATILRPMVERDDPHALSVLGWLYENSSLGAPNIELSQSYYERAAKLGNGYSCSKLGWVYFEDKKFDRAVSFLKRASKPMMKIASRRCRA